VKLYSGNHYGMYRHSDEVTHIATSGWGAKQGQFSWGCFRVVNVNTRGYSQEANSPIVKHSTAVADAGFEEGGFI
jgi:hypothetical protein